MKYSALSILFLAANAFAATPASLIFINGNIYTANEQNAHAEAVAVRNGRILAVGTNAEIEKLAGTKTRKIDLHGATMLPGLTDSHYHFIKTGLNELSFNLEGTKSISDLQKKLKARVSAAKPGAWIVGSGWIETFWKPARFPTRDDLDRAAPNNPVILTRADLHSAVANSAALKIAGITKSTKNPFGGEILHDSKTGEPNGMLVDNARDFVTRHIPKPDSAELERAMLAADKRSLAFGLTQVQEPHGNFHDVALYQKLYAAGKLKIRVYKAVTGPGRSANQLLKNGPIIEAYDHHLNVRAIKSVADGALGSRGAYLLEPYADAPHTQGFLTLKQNEYQSMLQLALQRGIQVETHAIGDAANHFVLGEYEKAMRAVPVSARKVSDPRWRIEHAQIVDPADIPRFAELGIIPSMQPSHAISDLHFAVDRLGLARLNGAYAWQRFIKSGVMVPGGSDAPVERGNPVIEFYAAVARKDLHGFSGPGWHPEFAVSRADALKMFTLWPAFAAFEEHLRGSIEPGKLADFTVVSADIMKIPEDKILQTRCVMTVIGGEIVYHA